MNSWLFKKKLQELSPKGGTIIKQSKTQLGSTPTLYGEDAEGLIDSLKYIPMAKSKENAKKLAEYFNKLEKFPEEKKNNPFFLMQHKNKCGIYNPNSPSDLEWHLEDEPEKLKIIEDHGFELLLMLESENITLKDAADKLIDWYENQLKAKEVLATAFIHNPVQAYLDLSEEDRTIAMSNRGEY